MTIDLARLAGQLARDLNPLGERIDACVSHLAYLDDLMPARGEQRDEFNALRQHIQWIHDAYCDIDEKLVQAAFTIDLERRVPNPEPIGESHKMQATRSGVSAPAIGNPGMRATA